MTCSCRPPLFRALTVLLATVALSACAAAPRLRVATSGDYPPFSVAKPYGAIVGFDTEVAAEFARTSGRRMYFVPLRWPHLVQQAKRGEFDVAMSGVTMRGDRLPNMLFSRPYAVTGAVVAVRLERAAELATLEQVDREGVRIAVNRGGHLERVARQRFTRAEILTVEDNRTLPDLVLRGEVDGAVSDAIEVGAWPVETFAVIGPFTRDRKAYAVPLEAAGLLAELNTWLAAREENGWLNAERRRWLSSDAVWTVDEACFEAIAAAIDMRMLLMPQVAAAKSRMNLPIEDPAREEAVLAQAAEWAEQENLSPPAVTAAFRQLIATAKVIQKQTNLGANVLVDADLDVLRDAIRFYSYTLVRELGRCRIALTRNDAEERLAAALHAGEALGAMDPTVAGDLAALLVNPERSVAQESNALAAVTTDAVAAAQPRFERGTYVEFCIPPNLRFDREGYFVEETVAGRPSSRELLSGRTRIRVQPGRHRYSVYVSGSSGDPRSALGADVPPSTVVVDVPEDQVVTVRYEPRFNADGEFELRWQDVYGAAVSGLETYRGLTRFDVETQVSEPYPSTDPGRCPW